MRIPAFTFACLLLAALTACKKADFRKARIDEVTVQSSFTQQDYLIRILLPEGYAEDREYPLVVLLDGFFHFEELGPDVVEMMQEGEIEDVIVAGIFYEDYPFEGKPGNLDNLSAIWDLRRTDLTFPADTIDPANQASGNAPAFFQFLTTELAPVLETAYSTDTTRRTLLGHSFGGYFALYQLLTHPNTPFYKRIGSLSPAVQWQDEYIFGLEEAAHLANAALDVDLYMGIGSLEGAEWNILVEAFGEQLREHAYPGLRLKVENYPGGHTYSANPGFINALRFLDE